MDGRLKRTSRPTSLVGDNGGKEKVASPLVRSPGLFNLNTEPTDETIETRFFHASDAPKHEPAPKKPEPKKPAAFFYADGKKEDTKNITSQATSPVLSAVSIRSSGPWIRPDGQIQSPPMLSPALSGLSATSPFFAPPAAAVETPRSPSPSKENIHLSYRKGVSQIFGTRPLQRPTEPIAEHPATPISRKESVDSNGGVKVSHRKSPSLSSIDSGNSHKSRRRSATTAEIAPAPSPLVHEIKAATVPRLAKAPAGITSIDTTLEPPGIASPNAELALSPTKSVSELASDARRERKVLDLEISNSSLLAINASLEREVRRQKAELKRFRRLSRAGRLNTLPERTARFSEGLSVVGEEEDEDSAENLFGPASGGLSELYSDISDSDDDDESVLSSEGPRSPGARQSHRLARDEKRLKVDLERHKELLVQSQMMNQSLKRCMYASEEMIREGRKALEYHVRVSDVKLGGRVLSSHEDEEDLDERPEIEVEDDLAARPPPRAHSADDHRDQDIDLQSPGGAGGSEDDGITQAKGLLDVWSSLGRPSYENSDRDSGIEVDRVFASLPLGRRIGGDGDMGRPPGGGV